MGRRSKRIRLRGDGNAQIGLGHIVRLVSLYHMLKSDHHVSFDLVASNEIVKNMLSRENVHFNQHKNEDLFLDSVGEEEIVAIDGYGFDLLYQKKIKNKGALLVAIDDFCRFHEADIIINHAADITPDDFPEGDGTLLLGLDYALLRPEFLSYARKGTSTENRNGLTICFGGADPQNRTLDALNAALPYLDDLLEITVVVTSSFQYEESLTSIIEINDRIRLVKDLSAHEMLEQFSRSTFVIVPASNVLYESLCSGSIIISGYYVDNQRRVYNGLKSFDCFIDAGNFEKATIKEAIEIALTGSFSTKKVIDGLSNTRIVASINNLMT